MANVNDSFSYDLRYAAEVQAAKDKAKEKGLSFSKYLVQLIQEDLKKNQDLGALGNLNLPTKKQTTIDLFTIPMEKLKDHIHTQTDKNLLGQFTKRAILIQGLSKTRLKNLKYE